MSIFSQTSCTRTLRMRALLLVLAPATLTTTPTELFGGLGPYPWLIAGAIAVFLFVASIWGHLESIWLRLMASGAFLCWVVGTLLKHLMEPGRGLIVLLGTIAFLAILWPGKLPQAVEDRHRREDADLAYILMVSSIAALFGLDEWYTFKQVTYQGSIAMTFTHAVPVLLAFRSELFRSGWLRKVVWCSALLAGLPLVGAGLQFLGVKSNMTHYGLLSPLGMLWVVIQLMLFRRNSAFSTSHEPGLVDFVLFHPARVLVFSFIAICAVGTLFLALPISSSSGKALPWIDAIFTAVSATCVTGLIVVDTPTAFGPFGQLVLLFLIQLGGLGIMVFSATAIVLLGERMSLSHERAAVEIVGADGRSGLMRGITMMFRVTLITEGAAAFLLFFSFLALGESVGAAAWKGLFTAVSAFCNAGFALQTDSLIPYARHPFVLFVISLTIIIGGLGPVVVAALIKWKEVRRRTLHVRLVLWMTGILLVVPTLLIAIIEWNGTLAHMSLLDKLSNAVFQSVTLRTAGFNSIDLAQVHPATWTIMLLTMFVGGSPGSTAGGIKTTTIAVVLLAIFAVIRGRERVELFGRTLPHVTIMRAKAVTGVAVFSGFFALFAIQLTQVIPLDAAIFEVVSALATVGLTTGGTGYLDEIGKLIIIVCMFAGRVGPLTLFVFLSSNVRDTIARRYPDEPVPIG